MLLKGLVHEDLKMSVGFSNMEITVISSQQTVSLQLLRLTGKVGDGGAEEMHILQNNSNDTKYQCVCV